MRIQVGRRLLGTTDMKVSDVAFVVGFGSVRQFNRVIAETYGLPPRALRDRPSGEDFDTAGGLALRFPTGPQYDWDRVRTHLASTAIPGVEWVAHAEYRRAIETTPGHVGLVEVHRPGDGQDVRVRLRLSSWTGVLHVVDRLRAVLGLRLGPTVPGGLPVRPVDGRDRWPVALFTPIHRGLSSRPIVEWSSFEAAAKAIVGLPGDHLAKDRLRAVAMFFGTKNAGEGCTPLRPFPTAGELATVAPEDLGMPMAIAVPLVELAAGVVEGSVPLSDSLPPSVRLRSFRSLDGVTGAMADRFAWLIGAPARLEPGAPAIGATPERPGPTRDVKDRQSVRI